MKITLISAFFDIGRANFTNTEYTRTNEKYFEYFKFWARMKNDLVVYTDSNSSKYVRDIRNKQQLLKLTIYILYYQTSMRKCVTYLKVKNSKCLDIMKMLCLIEHLMIM